MSGLLRNTRRNRSRRGPGQRRSGAAVVEFAIVAPLMMFMTLGMMEVGRMVMVKQLLVNASREGARLAVLPGASAEEVQSQVSGQLANESVSGVSVSLNPTALSTAPAGTAVTVTVSVPASAITWVPKPLFSFNTTLQASTTMRKESM